MLNLLEPDEMLALKELVRRHNFTGVCSALAAICSDWKNAKEIESDANRKVMIALETLFEGTANEAKLIMLNERHLSGVRHIFRHQDDYESLGEHMTEPDVVPPEKK